MAEIRIDTTVMVVVGCTAELMLGKIMSAARILMNR